MQDSIFTKIIKGDIPCHKVYEDDYTLAFLDIHPIQPGHVLVVHKSQDPFVWDMHEDAYHQLMDTVHKVGRRLRDAFPEKQRVGVIIEGLDVEDHAHVKVFPFSTDEEFRHKQDMSASPEPEELAELAKKLHFE